MNRTMREYVVNREMRKYVAERLEALHRTPCMWAATREAFVARVDVLLELIDVGCASLVQKTFRVPHTCAADFALLAAPVDDEWARAFVVEAAKLAGLKILGVP